MSRGLSLLAALLLLVALASAQEVNIAIGLGGRPAPKTIFEEIDDAQASDEAFRELWNAAAARLQIDLAIRSWSSIRVRSVLRSKRELAWLRVHRRRGSRPWPDVGSRAPSG